MNSSIPKIVLGSGSPRRSAILSQIGFDFTKIISDVPEDHSTFPTPEDAVVGLSKAKAEAAAENLSNALVIGADTLVALDGEILGKPESAEHAGIMLRMLSGKTHEVFTGITLIKTEGTCVSDFETTRVTFKKLEDWEIEAYIKTGSPFDKAGAYGIQDSSAVFIDKIEGCFYNVVGFPAAKFYKMLKKLYPEEIIKMMINL